ncbi:MAG: hypothetical protein ACREKE_00140, partial [bacterium]
TVCPAACNDTSILAAYNAAAAGDTIELEGDVQESDTLTRGIDITVESGPGGPYTWDATPGSSNPTLQFQNGNGAAFVMNDVILNNSSTAGGYDIYWNNSGTSISITASVLERTSTSINNNALIYEVGADSHSIDIFQSSLVGSGNDYGFYYASGNDDSVLIENSLLYGFTNSPYAAVYSDRNNTWGGVTLWFDDFFNDNIGYEDAYTGANSGATSSVWDDLFIGNGTDLALPTGLNMANMALLLSEIRYNGFGSQTQVAGMGAGNIFSMTAAATFVDPAMSGTPDLHEIAGAQSICAANDSQGVAVDKDNSPRPSGGADCFDIGAYQYRVSGTPTVTPTPSPTGTATATLTDTFTPTLSPSVTPTPVDSTASPTLTPVRLGGPFVLTPHYPNPDPATSSGVYLPYTVTAPAYVTMQVYDVSGELVRSWSSDPEFEPAGTYERLWDIRNSSGHLSASGVFLVRIDAVPADGGSKQEAWEKCAVAR